MSERGPSRPHRTGGLTDPLPRPLRRGLRALVFELVDQRGLRRPAPTLSVGVPGGPRATWSLEPRPGASDDDHALRTEVVSALLRRARTWTDAPVCWLTRPGHAAWHDLDAAWLSPSAAAFAEAGLPLVWVVVTRSAWHDPRSGLTRRWRRPRRRSRPAG